MRTPVRVPSEFTVVIRGFAESVAHLTLEGTPLIAARLTRFPMTRYVLLATIGIVFLLVACGDPESPPRTTFTPAPAPVLAIATASPVPVATPTPQSAVQSVSADQAGMTAHEYAEACGKLNAIDAEKYACFLETGEGGGKEGEREHAKWVDELATLKPPAELADFHEARTTKFSSSLTGPNHLSQAACVKEMESLDAMLLEVRSLLLEKGCLHDTEIRVAQFFLASRQRIATIGPALSPPTVQDYAERCADVRGTIPLMDTPSKIPQHLLLEMSELTPPPELEQLHKYTIMLFQHWMFQGIDEPVPKHVIEAGREALEPRPKRAYRTAVDRLRQC